MAKIWSWFKKVAGFFIMFEGAEHYVTSTISVVGMIHQHVTAISAWFLPCWDYVMGTIGILGSIVMIAKNKKN